MGDIEPVRVTLDSGKEREYDAVVLFEDVDWMDESPFTPNKWLVGIDEEAEVLDIIQREKVSVIQTELYSINKTTLGELVYTHLPDDTDDLSEATQFTKFAEVARRALGHGYYAEE
ncbi:hypothetical protein [Haloferax chudinovii]|uniref:Uncharacterized protein n=1 Tax=Haloferax chudinovii TaxID=1109010 RepID=A0ABD5XH67_9EURY